MSWIRVDQDLPDHRKSIELGIILNDDRAWTYVVQLWLWAARLEGDGDLSGVKPIVIARRAGWQGDPDEFINALRQVKFLDGFVLHDWTEYQAQRAEQARDRERKRLKRLKPSDGLPADTAGREPDTAGQNPPIPESPAPTGTGTSTRTGTKTKNEEPLSSADDAPAQVSLLPEPLPSPAPVDPMEAKIDLVLAHWQRTHGPNIDVSGETQAGLERRRRVRKHLKAKISVEQMIAACDGALRDAYIMGRDPRAPRAYRGVETILRDGTQIEKLAALRGGPIASTGNGGPLVTYFKPDPVPEWTPEMEIEACKAFSRGNKVRKFTVPKGRSLPEGFDPSIIPEKHLPIEYADHEVRP